MRAKKVTEGKWTGDLLEKLREELGPRYNVLKHSDRFTANIPDFSVSNGSGRTVWIEVKVLQKADKSLGRVKDYLDKPAQLHLAQKLGGFYLVHDPFVNVTLLIEAWEVAVLWHQLVDKRRSTSSFLSGDKFLPHLLKTIKERL